MTIVDGIKVKHALTIGAYDFFNLAWKQLFRFFEAQDVVTHMYLKHQLHTLKMKECETITKHMHSLEV